MSIINVDTRPRSLRKKQRNPASGQRLMFQKELDAMREYCFICNKEECKA